MSSSYRLVGFSAVLLVAAAGAGAQFSEPSHPLSQIDPVDIALNMSNQAIKNVSAVSFSNPSGGGYVIDNYEISDQSGVSELELVPPGASGQGQFRVKEANLNLSGSNITDVNTLRFEEGASIDGGISVEGTINLSGDLDMDGNDIRDVGNITEFFNNACGENQAVKDVYPNGTFVCGQAGGGLPTVLSINNTADRDINLSGQDLERVDELNPGGRDIDIGGDVISGGGSYTSDTSEVCIGDQCDT